MAVVAAGLEGRGCGENGAFRALLKTWSGSPETIHAGHVIHQRLGEFFAGEELHHEESSGDICLNREELRGLALSTSHAPMPGSPKFAGFEAALQQFSERYQQNGRIRLATRCWISAGRFGKPG